MFKNKTKKIILVWLCIVVLLMPYASTAVSIAAETLTEGTNEETAALGKMTYTTEQAEFISYFAKGKYNEEDEEMEYIGYQVNGDSQKSILKIYNKNELDSNYDLYCLEPDSTFPQANSELYNNRGISKEIGNYLDETTNPNYNAIDWMANNFLLKDATEKQKEAFIEKVFEELINYDRNNNVSAPTTVESVLENLSIEDITTAQQIALWYASDKINRYFDSTDFYENTTFEEKPDGSGTNGYNVNSADSIVYKYIIPELKYYDDFGKVSFEMSELTSMYFKILCNYLITNAMTGGNNQNPVTENYPQINHDLIPTVSISGNNDEYYVVGPFEVKSNGATPNGKYHISFSADINGIFEDRECTSQILEQDLNNILDQQYYIRISSNTNANQVALSITYDEMVSRIATVWEPTNAEYQKVIFIEPKTVKPEDDRITATLERGDLALRKYIYSIEGEVLNPSMAPDLKNLGTEVVANKAKYIANYTHSKEAKEVEKGNKVVYQINIYNEGGIRATALEITDYLPEGLNFVKNSEINTRYGWTISDDGRVAKTSNTSNNPLDALTSNSISMTYVQIECEVADTVNPQDILTNVAEITADDIKDIDSETQSIDKTTIQDTYSGNTENKKDLDDKDYFYKGIEDDDDFAKLIVKGGIFDLSLKKFITSINGEAPKTSREPKVDTTPLKNKEKNANYTTVKTPLTVQSGDIVKYKIRVYNEGTISGYVEELADYLPEGLGLLVKHNDNIDNYWSIVTATANGAKTVKLSEIENGTKNLKLTDFTGETSLEDATVITGKGIKITSTKLSSNKESNLLVKYDGTSNNLSYKDIEVTCIVMADNLENTQLKNVAEITKQSDENKQEITDRDSRPDTVNPNNYPGSDNNQDDHDYENLTEEAKIFDLSLQKFITGLNGEKVTGREPTITIDKDGKVKFNHTTEPLKTANTDLVEYTIRVYNEGQKDGYAAEIQDDIPTGLVFVTDNETNKKYGWKMYDKYGKETTDVNQATTVKTTYLSKEDSEARKEDALLEAFDPSKGTLSTGEVKIVFKVDESRIEKSITTEKRVVINTAEISRNQDEKGNDIEDDDSIPGNGNDKEDDIDKERIYIKYFDLALEKYLTKIIITEDGETREIEATDKDSLLKVEINRKKINTTVVKFMYDIVVTNQGEIEGFATEIKDYIPDGLKFVAEDNKDWKANSEKEVVTNALAKTLLEPGKSASTSIVLTWENAEDNLGIKTNVAEISEDYNEKGDTPDIDSTPNNNVDGEDDIDDAPVMLAISTGSAPTYIGLTFAVTVISATGIALIRKYVL